MCEQCEANTKSYGDTCIGNFVLHRARKNGNSLKKGDWCLVKINDPSFYWAITPYSNPNILIDAETEEEEKLFF